MSVTETIGRLKRVNNRSTCLTTSFPVWTRSLRLAVTRVQGDGLDDSDLSRAETEICKQAYCVFDFPQRFGVPGDAVPDLLKATG